MTLHLLPGTVIERGQHWTIATNLNQNLIGRLIVVAARDVDSVTALSPGELQDLHRHMGRTRVALDALFQPDQYNYAFLMNQDAQVHVHVVPRYAQPRQWAGETTSIPTSVPSSELNSARTAPSAWRTSPARYANTCSSAPRHQRADRLLVPLDRSAFGDG